MIDADELGVIRAAERGDERAWAALHSRYWRVIWNATARFRLAREDRENIVSETFLRLFQSKKPFDPTRSSLCALLCTIARNLCIDHLRKRSREVVVDPSTLESTDPFRLSPSASGPEVASLVRHVLQKDLDADQRLCLLLIYYHGYTYDETAKILCRDYHWVKNTLFRAREAFRNGFRVRKERRRSVDRQLRTSE